MADIDIWASGAGAVIQEPTDAKKETGFVACEQNTVGEWNWLFNEITSCLNQLNSRVDVDTRLTNPRINGTKIVWDVIDADGNVTGTESLPADTLINAAAVSDTDISAVTLALDKATKTLTTSVTEGGNTLSDSIEIPYDQTFPPANGRASNILNVNVITNGPAAADATFNDQTINVDLTPFGYDTATMNSAYITLVVRRTFRQTTAAGGTGVTAGSLFAGINNVSFFSSAGGDSSDAVSDEDNIDINTGWAKVNTDGTLRLIINGDRPQLFAGDSLASSYRTTLHGFGCLGMAK